MNNFMRIMSKPFGIAAFSCAILVGAHVAQGALISAAEISQIETDLNVTLSSNDIAQLSAIVLPTSMPAWRVDAYDRIDTHRKADLEIQVVDMNGDPVEGAQVAVKLKSNDFKFGGIMSLKDFTDEDNALGISVQEYRDRFLAMFNSAGLDNGFKPKQRAGNEPLIPNFLSWAQSNELPVRGHTLIWPGTPSNNHLPNELPDTATSYSVLSKIEAAEADPGNSVLLADLKSEVDYMIGDWASKWSVYEWDVINETLSNHRVQDLLGYEETAEWFKIAESNMVDPNCQLLINEYQIISARSAALSPTQYTDRRDSYFESIDYVIDNGGRLDRIGFQSRVKFEVPNPQTWYDRLEEFSQAYGRIMVGTEFEVRDTDPPESTWYPYDYTEQERAEITESLLTAYFSHPMTDGLHAWTYMKGYDREYSMCYYDGTVKLNGLAWYYLHRIRYNTDVTLASSLGGKTDLRAFKGDYDVTVSYKGQDYAVALAHTNDQSIVITLMSSIADDSNTSEVVDAWSYDALTNGAGLAQGISTGTVGGVFFDNNTLASMQNETVRWQSDGVSDSIYQGEDSSSYDGTNSGLFQLSVDFLDADFSATSELTNGIGRVNFGLRNDPGGSSDDAYFRLTFVSGGGSNTQYRLEVKDGLNNNLNVASFPGTTLEHLNVRAVFDLDNTGTAGSFKVYYRKDGAGEVLAHNGQLLAGFAMDQMRTVVQTFNGGANWAAGDQIFTDNLILRKLGDPPPPPPIVVVEEWLFDDDNGTLFDGLTNTAPVPNGLAVWGGNYDFVYTTNGVLRFDQAVPGTQAVYRNSEVSQPDTTNGQYELRFDFPAAQCAGGDATGATCGFGLRDSTLNKDAFIVRLIKQNDKLQLQSRIGAINTTLVQFGANYLEQALSVRVVADYDTDTIDVFYAEGAGGELVATNGMPMLQAHMRLDMVRMAAVTKSVDFGADDFIDVGELVLSAYSRITDSPESLLADWLAEFPGLGSQTNLTDNPDMDVADNLLEYAFGGDPTNVLDIGYWPTFQTLEDGGFSYIEYVYAKRSDAEARGLTYTLLLSTNLVSEIWTNSGYTVTGSNDVDSAYQTITNRVPTAGENERFLRLQVEFQ